MQQIAFFRNVFVSWWVGCSLSNQTATRNSDLRWCVVLTLHVSMKYCVGASFKRATNIFSIICALVNLCYHQCRFLSISYCFSTTEWKILQFHTHITTWIQFWQIHQRTSTSFSMNIESFLWICSLFSWNLQWSK